MEDVGGVAGVGAGDVVGGVHGEGGGDGLAGRDGVFLSGLDQGIRFLRPAGTPYG